MRKIKVVTIVVWSLVLLTWSYIFFEEYTYSAEIGKCYTYEFGTDDPFNEAVQGDVRCILNYKDGYYQYTQYDTVVQGSCINTRVRSSKRSSMMFWDYTIEVPRPTNLCEDD